MLRTALPVRAAAAGLLLAAACRSDDVTQSAAPPPPGILAAAVAANRHNVLSAVVTVRVRLADSVTVRYGAAGAALDGATAAVVPRGDSAVVPVLGLLPGTRYRFLVVAHGAGDALGDTLTFVSGALPDDLPQYTAGGPDPSPGYVVFAAGKYGLVIDNTGRIVWYRRFPDPLGPGLNFQAQPTGRYVARPPTPDPAAPGAWVEMDPLGEVTRILGCAGGLQPRFHDLLALPDGSYWIMCDERRAMDLSGVGGLADAEVMGTVVQLVSGDGSLLFQ
ncbi:MAG: hypothetical protein WD043_05430 [Gemmatimonadales bacterium]